ncbi:hypothetical protein [Burkholderia cepacia]|uniref:hypothetical protein n=1 Tax=Burkholderia cepacia TaxID=292 RepID=UPI002AB5E8F7|nr:hypothetical protein [Burkholderia cepacia]
MQPLLLALFAKLTDISVHASQFKSDSRMEVPCRRISYLTEGFSELSKPASNRVLHIIDTIANLDDPDDLAVIFDLWTSHLALDEFTEGDHAAQKLAAIVAQVALREKSNNHNSGIVPTTPGTP